MRHATRPSTEQRASFMRVYVRRQLVAEGEYPTPTEVTEEVGGDVGLAMQVLDEFPGDSKSARPRRRPTMRRASARTA